MVETNLTAWKGCSYIYKVQLQWASNGGCANRVLHWAHKFTIKFVLLRGGLSVEEDTDLVGVLPIVYWQVKLRLRKSFPTLRMSLVQFCPAKKNPRWLVWVPGGEFRTGIWNGFKILGRLVWRVLRRQSWNGRHDSWTLWFWGWRSCKCLQLQPFGTRPLHLHYQQSLSRNSSL